MSFKPLRLNLQHFAEPGAATATATTAAAAPDTSLAGAGDHNAAAGGDTQQGAAGDTTAGGGDTNQSSGSNLSPEDLKRYEESDFLKALGITSIKEVQDALAAAKQAGETKQADDKKAPETTAAADKKDETPAEKKADDKTGEKKADETPPEKKAEETPEKAKEPEKKAEPTIEDKETEIADLKAQLAAAKNGVPEESLEDVLTLAKAAAAKGDGLEIDAAIKAIILKYPSFLGEAAPAPETPHFGSGGSTRNETKQDPFLSALLNK